MSNELERVKGIGPVSAQRLGMAGITTIEQLKDSRPEDLAWIKGIGIKSATTMIQRAKELFELEKGLVKVLDAIKENFVKSCPKCGGEMESKYVILSPQRRQGVYQCKLCKFYLPR